MARTKQPKSNQDPRKKPADIMAGRPPPEVGFRDEGIQSQMRMALEDFSMRLPDGQVIGGPTPAPDPLSTEEDNSGASIVSTEKADADESAGGGAPSDLVKEAGKTTTDDKKKNKKRNTSKENESEEEQRAKAAKAVSAADTSAFVKPTKSGTTTFSADPTVREREKEKQLILRLQVRQAGSRTPDIEYDTEGKLIPKPAYISELSDIDSENDGDNVRNGNDDGDDDDDDDGDGTDDSANEIDRGRYPLLHRLVFHGSFVNFLHFMDKKNGLRSQAYFHGPEFRDKVKGVKEYKWEVQREFWLYKEETVPLAPLVDLNAEFVGQNKVKELNISFNASRFCYEIQAANQWLAMAAAIKDQVDRETGWEDFIVRLVKAEKDIYDLKCLSAKVDEYLKREEEAKAEKTLADKSEEVFQFFFGATTSPGAAAAVALKHKIPSLACERREDYMSGKMRLMEHITSYEDNVITWMRSQKLIPPSAPPGRFRAAANSSPLHTPGSPMRDMRSPQSTINASRMDETGASDTRSVSSMVSASKHLMATSMLTKPSSVVCPGGLYLEVLSNSDANLIIKTLLWLQGLRDFRSSYRLSPLYPQTCSASVMEQIKDELTKMRIDILDATVEDIVSAVGRICHATTPSRFYQLLQKVVFLPPPTTNEFHELEPYFRAMERHCRQRIPLALEVLGAHNPNITIRMWLPEGKDSVAHALIQGCGNNIERFIDGLSDSDPNGLRMGHDIKNGNVRSLPSSWTDQSKWRWSERSTWVQLLGENVILFGINNIRAAMLANFTPSIVLPPAPVLHAAPAPVLHAAPASVLHVTHAPAPDTPQAQQLMAYPKSSKAKLVSGGGGLQRQQPPFFSGSFNGKPYPPLGPRDNVVTGDGYKQMPCYDEEKKPGSCKRGTACKYSHDPEFLSQIREGRESMRRRNNVNLLSSSELSRLAVMHPSEAHELMSGEQLKSIFDDSEEDDEEIPDLVTDSSDDEY